CGDFRSPTVEITLNSKVELQNFVTPLSSGCPLHTASIQRSVELRDARESAKEMLEVEGAQSVELDWPICVAARCLDCGCEWKPLKRVAWFRRYGVCPSCRGRRILENQNLSSLDRNSPWAVIPLADLGLPKNHYYALRTFQQDE